MTSFCCEHELLQQAKAKCKEQKITISEMYRLLLQGYVSGHSNITIVNENPHINVNVTEQGGQATTDELDAEIFGQGILVLLEQVKLLRRGEQSAFDARKNNISRSGDKDHYYTDTSIRPDKIKLRDEILRTFKLCNKYISDDVKKEVLDDLRYLNRNKWSLLETAQI